MSLYCIAQPINQKKIANQAKILLNHLISPIKNIWCSAKITWMRMLIKNEIPVKTFEKKIFIRACHQLKVKIKQFQSIKTSMARRSFLNIRFIFQ
jgi:hypothetical protein